VDLRWRLWRKREHVASRARERGARARRDRAVS
jgi:hypothetical protein